MTEHSYLKNVLGMQDGQALAEVLKICRMRRVKKGDCLFCPGEYPAQIHLLVSGIFRGFFLDTSGNEITDCLIAQPGYPLVPSSNLKEPSSTYIEALTPSSVLTFEIADLLPLVNQYPEINAIYEKMVLLSAAYHRQLKLMMYQYTASQRYQWFLKHYPDTLDQISHRYIASFLNMTPVTLSRLINRHLPLDETTALIDSFSFSLSEDEPLDKTEQETR